MIKAKINGKPVQIETSWEEVSFGKFLDLIVCKDDYKQVLAVMLGESIETIQKAKFDGLERILPALKFLQVPAQIEEKPIKLGTFTFPQDIGMESVEKFECLREAIKAVAGKEDLRTQTEALAYYAAIYIQEPFDEGEARKLAETFKALPCLEVMSAGSFFMAKVLSMQSGLTMNFLRKNTPMKKNKRGSGSLMKRLGSTALSILSLGMWGKTTKSLSKSGA
jgi:hypothetical protein